MSATHTCQSCGRAVVLLDSGKIIRSCLFSDECMEPVAAEMSATAYGLARIEQMSPEERAEKNL